MSTPQSPIRDISDTARWVAIYRARESEKPNPVFNDPFARRLAGELGEGIAGTFPFAEKHSWPFVARTWLIDQLVAELVPQGVDTVINLAAGLDARPYRLELPPRLHWIEVDLPEILDYKEEVLRSETPVCTLERIKLDLSAAQARRGLFAQLGGRFSNALVIAEGLLVYLDEDEVGALARDLAAAPGFCRWIVDIASPTLLRMLKKNMAPLEKAGLPLKFSPGQGPEFFRRHGWRPEQVRSIIHTAAHLKRLAFHLRLIARFSSPEFRADRPWSAVCLLTHDPGGQSGLGTGGAVS